MLVISKQFTCLLDNTLNMIQGQSLTKIVIFSYKNNIGFHQLLIFFTRFCDVGIHQAAVVTRSFAGSASICALHLNVVKGIAAVNGQDVQSDRTPPQVFQVILSVDFDDLQIVALEQAADQQLSTLLVLENYCHEGVVNQTIFLDAFQFLLPFLVQIHGVITSFIFYTILKISSIGRIHSFSHGIFSFLSVHNVR